MVWQEAVRSFFQHTLGEEQDEAVCAYVAEYVADEEGVDMEELRDLIAGFAPSLEALPREEQKAALLRLLHGADPEAPEAQQAGGAAHKGPQRAPARAARAATVAAPVSAAAAAAAAALAGLPRPGSAGRTRSASASPVAAPARAAAVAATPQRHLRALSLSSLHHAEADEDGRAVTGPTSGKMQEEAEPVLEAAQAAAGPTSEAAQAEAEPISEAVQAAEAAVSLLQDICPLLPPAFLAHVLAERCGGRVNAAAAYLLDSHDLAGEYAAWEAEEAKRALALEQAEREKELDRAKIVRKFLLEAVAEGSARKPPEVQAWSAKEKRNSKVRYRDGMMVTHKGEKYIVEKLTEDWDGGSRGKVFTKGKRGKGFV